MNLEQKGALVREAVTAIAALVASFNLLGSELVSNVVALTVAVIMWGIAYRYGVNAWASFARKSMQAVSPVLVYLGYIDATQGVSMTAVLLLAVSVWTKFEKDSYADVK
jgi:hypothetical protein